MRCSQCTLGVPDTCRVTSCIGGNQVQQAAHKRSDSTLSPGQLLKKHNMRFALFGPPNATFNGAVIGWRRVPTTQPRGGNGFLLHLLSPAASRKKRPGQPDLPSSVAKTSQTGTCQAVFFKLVRPGCMWPAIRPPGGAWLERPRIGGIEASRQASSVFAASFSPSHGGACHLSRTIGTPFTLCPQCRSVRLLRALMWCHIRPSASCGPVSSQRRLYTRAGEGVAWTVHGVRHLGAGRLDIRQFPWHVDG